MESTRRYIVVRGVKGYGYAVNEFKGRRDAVRKAKSLSESFAHSVWFAELYSNAYGDFWEGLERTDVCNPRPAVKPQIRSDPYLSIPDERVEVTSLIPRTVLARG